MPYFHLQLEKLHSLYPSIMASQHTVAAASSAIKHPKNLITLSVKLAGNKNADALQVRYRNARCYAITAMTWLDVPMHRPTEPYFSRRWEERKEPFWWSAISYKPLSSKKTVRSMANRKLRHAFEKSLKNNGYDVDGNRLPGTGGGQPLTGTAQLQPLEPILKLKMPELILQTDATVKKIMSDLKRYGNTSNQRRSEVGSARSRNASNGSSKKRYSRDDTLDSRCTDDLW